MEVIYDYMKLLMLFHLDYFRPFAFGLLPLREKNMKRYLRAALHEIDYDFAFEDLESSLDNDEQALIDDEYDDEYCEDYDDEYDEYYEYREEDMHTLSDFQNCLERLSESTDYEGAHFEADRTLLGVIEYIASNMTLPEGDAAKLLAIVDGFKKIHKWYA